MSEWHPYVATCDIENDEPDDKLGCIRKIVLKDGGGIVRETLLALSDTDHRIIYDIVDSPMPVENYVATITLKKTDEGNKTSAHWSVEFDTDEENSEMMINTLNEIYRSGFECLGAETNESI